MRRSASLLMCVGLVLCAGGLWAAYASAAQIQSQSPHVSVSATDGESGGSAPAGGITITVPPHTSHCTIKGGNTDAPDLNSCDPTCAPAAVNQLPPAAQRNCAASGSPAEPVPTDHFGLDNNVANDPNGSNSALHPATATLDAILAGLQAVFVQMPWLLAINVLHIILLLFSWAFSLDLLNQAMSPLKNALDTLHNHVLGDAWTAAALSAAALWGIWHGLVRQRASETIGGLAATLAMMLVALAITAAPDSTIGPLSALAHQGAATVLAGISGGNATGAPVANIATVEGDIFSAVVADPWCELEFGDLAYCNSRPTGGLSVAQVWRQFPADSLERQDFYRMTATGPPGDAQPVPTVNTGGGNFGSTISGGPSVQFDQTPATTAQTTAKRYTAIIKQDPSKVAMQGASGTLTRIGLLGLMLVGLLGAIVLFGGLTAALLIASLMMLPLVLMMPIMLLAPGFGITGRQTFIAYLRRLAVTGALQLIVAFALGVILLGNHVIAQLTMGPLATWGMYTLYWWTAVIKRHEIMGLLSLDSRGEMSRGAGAFRLASLWYGMRMAGAAARVATAAPRAGISAVRRQRHYSKLGGSEATAQGATRDLAAQARRSLQIERQEELDTAHDTVGRNTVRVRHLNGRIGELTKRLEKGNLTGDVRRQRIALRDDWAAKRDQARTQLNDAHRTIARSQDGKPPEPTEREVSERVNAWRGQHERREMQPDAPENLRAAGIRVADYDAASGDAQKRDAFLQRSQESMARRQELFDRADVAGSRRALPAATRWNARDEARRSGGSDAFDAQARDASRAARRDDRSARKHSQFAHPRMRGRRRVFR